jgi:hypothetical protein
MAGWGELEAAQPRFAASARARLDARVHKTIATLCADGAPRISGIETFWAQDELWFGSMAGARKGKDLRRDPRFALHSGSDDPPDWPGDAKLSGRAVQVDDPQRLREIFGARGQEPPDGAELFGVDLELVTLVSLNEARDRLVIEWWRPGEPLRRLERE